MNVMLIYSSENEKIITLKFINAGFLARECIDSFKTAVRSTNFETIEYIYPWFHSAKQLAVSHYKI